jgi:hypothetical protein
VSYPVLVVVIEANLVASLVMLAQSVSSTAAPRECASDNVLAVDGLVQSAA